MRFLDRLRARLIRKKQPVLGVGDPGLVVVASAFDPAEADSAVLARSPGWTVDAQAVLRHHLRLPAAKVDEAAGLAGLDGYTLTAAEVDENAGQTSVTLARTQVLTPLSCAQERSRMASLAQRLGGDALGWDALQPGESETDNIGTPHSAQRRTP